MESNKYQYRILCALGEELQLTIIFSDFNRENEELETLSSLGHFLKGSSATLGLIKIRDGCEAIQRYGKNENLDGSSLPDDEKCLKLIGDYFKAVKEDYATVEALLRQYYEQKE